MQIDGYVQALREDLARIAAVGDESTARAGDALSVALESAVGRRLLEALGEAALELNSQLDGGPVEIRFAGSDPELVYVPHAAAPPPELVARPRRGAPPGGARRRGVHRTHHAAAAGEPQDPARRSRRSPRRLR